MPDITITSPETHGKTTIGVNGDTRTIKHNTRTNVTDSELEVLQNGDLGVGKLVEHEDETDDAADATSTVDEAMKAGTEASHVQAPATPASTSSEPNPLAQGEGGNAVTGAVGGDHEIGGKPAGSSDGDQQDSSQESGDQSFDAAGALDKPMNQIDVASFEASQIDALIEAEKARENPRSTLIDKLEARKAKSE